MTAITATEGAKVLFDLIHKGDSVDRGTNLDIGLFTNTGTIDDIKALALTAITEPTGGGYARKTLTDANWDNSVARISSYAKQTFTATGGAMTGTIYGWFIATKGTTPRLMYAGKFDDAPSGITLADGSSISYTPKISA
jgi:hypothetical protein